MKRFLLFTFTLLFSLNLFSQQNQVFKISYKFRVDESLLQIDENETDEAKKTLAATAAVAMMFQEEGKPIAQVWVDKDFVRAKSNLYSENYEITNKKTSETFIVYPSTEQYYINTEPRDKVLELGDDFVLASEMPIEFISNEEKTIAGYKCKLGKVTFSDGENNSVEIHIWYTEAIPNIYWGEYAYLKNIPGAALEISTSGLGIIADQVEIEKSEQSIFAIPETYTQLDSPATEDFSLFDDTDSLTENNIEEYDVAENRVAFLDKETQLYGLKDYDDNIIIEPAYSSIYQSAGRIIIVLDEEYNFGAIDLDGNILLPLDYESLSFSEVDNMFIFSKNGKYGLLSVEGTVLIPNEYDHINFMKQGHAIIMVSDKYGIIDAQNKIVVAPKYHFITENTGKSFISFEEDAVYALYSFDGKKKTTYEYLTYAGEGDLFLVLDKEKYGYVNAEGKIVIPLKYTYATIFENGVAMVMIDGKEDVFYINPKGEEVK